MAMDHMVAPVATEHQLQSCTSSQCPCTLKRGLNGGIQDLGETPVTELVLEWLDAVITATERDRIMAWHLGVSL